MKVKSEKYILEMSSEQKICFCGYQALDEELMEMHIDYSHKDIVNQTV